MAKTDFKMADYSKNKNIFYILKTRNDQVNDSIDITYGMLDQIFKVSDEEDISVKQIIPCLAFHPSVLEKWKWNCPHRQKTTKFCGKKLKPALKKSSNDLDKLHPNLS